MASPSFAEEENSNHCNVFDSEDVADLFGVSSSTWTSEPTQKTNKPVRGLGPGLMRRDKLSYLNSDGVGCATSNTRANTTTTTTRHTSTTPMTTLTTTSGYVSTSAQACRHKLPCTIENQPQRSGERDPYTSCVIEQLQPSSRCRDNAVQASCVDRQDTTITSIDTKSALPNMNGDMFEQGESSSETAINLVTKGFTLRQLLYFYLKLVRRFGERVHRTSTLHVVQDVILPECMNKKSSYMESDFMQSCGGAQLAKTYVCHAWDSLFLNTVLNIALDASGWNKEDFQYSFCVFGVQEGRVQGICAGEMLRQLGNDILDKTYWMDVFAVSHHVHWRNCGSRKLERADPSFEIHKFDQVMHDTESLVVSLDPELHSFTRIWVVTELVEALKRSKPVCFRLALGLSKAVISKLKAGLPLTPPVDKCTSAIQDDRDYILQQSEHALQNPDAFNQLVWSMTELCLGVTSRLPKALEYVQVTLQNLRFLHMDTSYREFSSLEDLGWQHSWRLLKRLQHLHIDLSYGSIEQNGFDLLGERLKELVDLQTLKINLSHMKVTHGSCKPIAYGIQSLGSMKHFQFHADETLLYDIHTLGNSLGNLKALLSIDVRFHWPNSSKFQDIVDVDDDIACLGHGLERLEHLQELRVCFSWPLTSDSKFNSGLCGIFSFGASLRELALQAFEANLVGCNGMASSLRQQVFHKPLDFVQAIADAQTKNVLAGQILTAAGISEESLFDPKYGCIDVDSHLVGCMPAKLARTVRRQY